MQRVIWVSLVLLAVLSSAGPVSAEPVEGPEAATIATQKRHARLTAMKKLEEQLKSDRLAPVKRADFVFRLMEYSWEEATYQNARAKAAFEKARTCFQQRKCKEAPVPPHPDFSAALARASELLTKHSVHPKVEWALHYQGRAWMAIGTSREDRVMVAKGASSLRRLIESYPKSPLCADAHVRIADHYFESGGLYIAKVHYEATVDKYETSPLYPHALHRLGWVFYNLAEFEKALDIFKRVMLLAAQPGVRVNASIRAQLLRDLVLAWAELDSGWQAARAYLVPQLGEAEAYEALEMMAKHLMASDKDVEALELYDHLIARAPTSPKVVGYYAGRLDLWNRLADEAALEREIARVARALEPAGAWSAANRTTSALAHEADALVAKQLIFLASRYHRRALKAEDDQSPSKRLYEEAAKHYAAFLVRFPKHPRSYTLRFYYAEILFDALVAYDQAAAQYLKVIEADPVGAFLEDAALGRLYAAEKLRGATALDMRFVEACDGYVSVVSHALDDAAWRAKHETAGKMLPTARYMAADEYARHRQFPEALRRFEVLFDTHPSAKMGAIAVNRIITIHAEAGRFAEAEAWAQKLIASGNFTFKSRREMEAIAAAAASAAKNAGQKP